VAYHTSCHINAVEKYICLLFVAYHTSRHIHSLHMSGFDSAEKVYFVIVYETVETVTLLCFPRQPHSPQCLQAPDEDPVCFFVLFQARCLSLVSSCLIVVSILEVFIACV